MRRFVSVLVLAGLLCVAGAVTAQTVDYGDAASWLCRPGRADACAVDLTTTAIAADGTMTREAWTGDRNAPIDCFYVYPTVSTDTTPNSDMTADPAEANVVRQQFARFGSVCRPYAPLYRQVTLAGLRRMIAAGGGSALGGGMQLEDVRNAWRHYLEHDNQGRGVVIVGHSQGSFILAEVIRQEVDGKPIQSRIVSAILMGATLSVPRGRDVGGTFQQMPACRSAAQTGCIISFVSFRSTAPPSANSRFGRVPDATMSALCTNPAALAGGTGDLRAYLSTAGSTITSTTKPAPWVAPGPGGGSGVPVERAVETPWVSVPGLLTARCATNEYATYLEVTVHGNPGDPRTDDITGDLVSGNQVLADWGLHLVDVNLAIGNLIDIVRQQSKAWVSRSR